LTAESACILTAETVDLLFYQMSLFLAIPPSLIMGTATLATVESVEKIKNTGNGYWMSMQWFQIFIVNICAVVLIQTKISLVFK
jgi:hypothetical protein